MARKQQALSYLPFTLTQAGADGFIQATIATALSGLTKVSYRLAEIQLDLPRVSPIDQSNLQFSLTRKSFAAMPTSLEKSLIWSWSIQSASQSAVGFAFFEKTKIFRFSDDDAPIIVEDPIYAQFKSALTTLTQTVTGRLGYWQDSISEVDRLTLVANSLS